MDVYIFTNKEEAIKKLFPKTAKFFALKELAEHAPENDSLSYIDVSNLSDVELKKILTQIKSICKCWGIIDPKGNIKDTAELFFEGASDYLGSVFFKNPVDIDLRRIKRAIQWRKDFSKKAASGDESASEGAGVKFLNPGIKLPAVSAFPGWKKAQTGKVMPFYLLYCSLQGKISLDDRFDGKTVAQIHRRFLDVLEDNLLEGDGLLWMNSGKDCLFLIPPRAKNVEEAVKACIKMLVSSPMITLEKLNLKIPANFTFALHYGSLSYKPPGKTGTIVSDAVNFIFHLGAKKAECGRLSISGELPGVSIPKTLQDCFIPAGEFEGRNVWHTKKFNYAKPWM
jgi:hypothetical protein